MVSASTQNQALSALLFLYQHVLNQPVGWINPAIRAQRPKRLPIVLTKPEVKAVLDFLDGSPKRMAALRYGAGLRRMECLQLMTKARTMDDRIEQIIEYVLDNGEVTKDDILNAFDVVEEEYAEVKRAVLNHPLIEAGAKHTGGFVVRKRAGKTPDETEAGPTFSTEWENAAVQRLCELLQHRELEELLGPVVQTVRQARTHAIGRRVMPGVRRRRCSSWTVQVPCAIISLDVTILQESWQKQRYGDWQTLDGSRSL